LNLFPVAAVLITVRVHLFPVATISSFVEPVLIDLPDKNTILLGAKR
jgi:hypothetical protein